MDTLNEYEQSDCNTKELAENGNWEQPITAAIQEVHWRGNCIGYSIIVCYYIYGGHMNNF